MKRLRSLPSTIPKHAAATARAVASAKRARHGTPLSKRARGGRPDSVEPFAPPEDWHEPTDRAGISYRIIVQPAGRGHRHILTPDDIRRRLAQLPGWMLEPLDVVQLSRMTRKKQSFPCYGMQWGSALYLYPLEERLIEYYGRPPKPAQANEVRQYGGKWIELPRGGWQLVWTLAAIRDFYLNNILIHELGHLLDNRNGNSKDRERYAEWFARRHGDPHRPRAQRRPRQVRRRHHRV